MRGRTRRARIAHVAGGIDDPLSRLRYLKAAAAPSSVLHRWILWLSLLLMLLAPFLIKLLAGKPELPRIAPIPVRRTPPREPRNAVPVWEVEQTSASEVYSNGLRIDTRFTVPHRPRLYTAFQRTGNGSVQQVRRTQAAGIVYHTSESCQAPFDAAETPLLKRLGESLLEYVCRKRAYHYLIDRFGRVYRVVAEADSADHAGYSVWADEQWFYVNLNESFLGVSFEAQTNAGQTGGVASPAQVRAAAMLTEMLRSRYQIPAANCVTHAQVSVNPSNMLVGYHTDWAVGFPFRELGLPDNYQTPLPALWVFGFDCDAGWLATSGVSRGVRLAEQDVARGAAAAGMRPAAYRKVLRERYRTWLSAVRRTSPPVGQPGSGSVGR